MYSCHLLTSSASVRSTPFLYFIVPIYAWKFPLVSLIFLKRSLLFPILLFPSIFLHWSPRKPFLTPCYSEQDPVSPSVSHFHQEASISLLSFSIRGQTDWKPQSQKTNQSDHMDHSLSNSVKLWAMPCRATQDRQVMMERSDKMWSTREGNGKPLQYSCLENPMNSMKRQKERTLNSELPRSVDAKYAIGNQWRNSSRNNEEMEPKQKQHPVVDVTGDRSKVRCCKEQYFIGTWNVRSMNQGKLKVVKQEMARVNVDILGISELKWTGMGEFNSDNHYIYYCGQESLRRNGVAIIVNKRVWNAVLGCNLKNNRMISFHF